MFVARGGNQSFHDQVPRPSVAAGCLFDGGGSVTAVLHQMQQDDDWMKQYSGSVDPGSTSRCSRSGAVSVCGEAYPEGDEILTGGAIRAAHDESFAKRRQVEDFVLDAHDREADDTTQSVFVSLLQDT